LPRRAAGALPQSFHLADLEPCNQPSPKVAIGRWLETSLYPRYADPRLIEALADSPVVLIHGPRQSGKTTLAQMVGEPRQYIYVSFDDDVAQGAAEADSMGFVADLPERAILDEVQQVPPSSPR